ncbi:hypothetical protein D5S18_28135 [Nocardia panacis]|uniref:Uncharacterized protein n=1 Tax=Nocardia panacis TaxID=2340916 RepID=A0A3A4K9D6_9NOCA|nr:hypothetical protein [Nocardia panacis]RJO69773.1 hypothetical protein D5S18_28135 [Nocardia panacis]
MSDTLAMFWHHWVPVRRYNGNGAAGSDYQAPVGERCNVAVKRQIVRDSSGDEFTSSITVVFPPTVPYIAPGSEIVLPAEFGGGTANVVSVAVSHAGPPFPDTQVVSLE